MLELTLVGKVEAGIPEDDPRNPATIADNVGDNVGDVAGMGADLFGSYVATILGNHGSWVQEMGIAEWMILVEFLQFLLPMVIAGLGLIFSIVGTMFVKVKGEDGSVQGALNMGNWMSIAYLQLIASYPLTYCGCFLNTMQCEFFGEGLQNLIYSMFLCYCE